MDFYEYESRVNRPLMMKLAEFSSNERLKHLIFTDQLDPSLLDHLGNLADMIRTYAQTKEGCEFLASQLHHKRTMLYFTQPSTRTFLSFMAACQSISPEPGLAERARVVQSVSLLRMAMTKYEALAYAPPSEASEARPAKLLDEAAACLAEV